MARNEQEREDLFREATAYSLRGEFGCADLPATEQREIVFVGLKPDGQCSCYFGADPVYHFDSQGRLRRAYVAGTLYRTQGTTLARLIRERQPTESQLLRSDLTSAELQEFLQSTHADLAQFVQHVLQKQLVVLQATADTDDFRTQVLQRCQQILAHPIALAPRIPGRR